jgi:hypothetical protein
MLNQVVGIVTTVHETLILLFQFCSGHQYMTSLLTLAVGIAIGFSVVYILLATAGSFEVLQFLPSTCIICWYGGNRLTNHVSTLPRVKMSDIIPPLQHVKLTLMKNCSDPIGNPNCYFPSSSTMPQPSV